MSSQSLDVIEDRKRLAALLPPIRREILRRLHSEADSATGLASKMEMPRQKVNYHVRCLEKAGLLELDSERQRRGCTERRFRPAARAYLISPGLLGGLEEGEARDRFSSAYLIGLAARTVRDVARQRRRAREAGKRLATFALEADVSFRSPAERSAFAEELTDFVARLAARYHHESPESRPHRVVIGAHPVPKEHKQQGEDSDGQDEERKGE